MVKEIEKRRLSRVGCLGIIAAILVVIIGIPGGVYCYYKCQTNRGITEAASRISAYLEQKYHKKFNLSNGHYIWATSSYTFDASPFDDPEFKFPAFISKAFDKGIGDFYALVKNSREMKLLISPYVGAISKNNHFSAACDPATKDDPENKLLADVRRNMLTPEQMLSKYPGKIYMSTHISYAFDVTDQNREQIFKGVFSLVEFLKQKGFGYVNIVVYFYPSNILGGKTIKEVYGDNGNKFENKYWKERTYYVTIGTDALPNIKKWQDIGNYFTKRDTKNKR